MSKIAIVGTSNLNNFEWSRVVDIIGNEGLRQPKIEVVTGDADGVDSVARVSVSLTDCITTVFHAPAKQWEDKEGMEGFKTRNTKIAEYCDELICITTSVKIKKCYHCNADHQRTGGCWTMKEAARLGKPVRLYVV